MKVKIVVTRSLLGRFTWDMVDHSGNKIASAPDMFTRRASCMRIVNKLARVIGCPVEQINLETDFEY